jgi:hypothetical protein
MSSPGRTHVFLYERHVSQFKAGCASRFFAGQTLRLALAGFLFQVEPQFLLDLGFFVRPPHQAL